MPLMSRNGINKPIKYYLMDRFWFTQQQVQFGLIFPMSSNKLHGQSSISIFSCHILRWQLDQNCMEKVIRVNLLISITYHLTMRKALHKLWKDLVDQVQVLWVSNFLKQREVLSFNVQILYSKIPVKWSIYNLHWEKMSVLVMVLIWMKFTIKNW